MAVERHATASDINRLIEIRGAVQENRLSDPLSVTLSDYQNFVGRNRVWVTEVDEKIAGFSASDWRDGTIWALFVDPYYERAGIGTRLLQLACNDLKSDGYDTAYLTTDAGTKAAALYQKLGWKVVGVAPSGEMRFKLLLK